MKINNRTNFLTISLVTVIVLCGLFLGAFLILNNSNNRNQESAIQTSRDWAGLNEFPENSEIIETKAEGSAFTREFKITYTAPPEEIRRWLIESPGTSEVQPEIQGNFEIYHIKPRNGAQFAEVLYNRDTNEVIIRAYWS
jgi:hypothetical protein